MKSISLKLQEQILNDTEQISEQQLSEESKLVAEDSMKVLYEFESLLDRKHKLKVHS